MSKATDLVPDGLDNRYCNAKRRGSTERCGQRAGWGTDHAGFGPCKLHGGSTWQHRRHAEKLQAAEAVVTYGLSRQIDPQAALLEELHRTAGHVAWLNDLVAGLEDTELKQRMVGKGGMFLEAPAVWLDLYERERRHFTDVARACIAAGIAERQVRLAEQQGNLIAQVLRGVLADLGLADDPRVPGVVRQHLMLVEGEAS